MKKSRFFLANPKKVIYIPTEASLPILEAKQ